MTVGGAVDCELCSAAKLLAMPSGYQPAGRVSMQCLSCRARLVLSTTPDKGKANVMLACIARHDEAPSRASILAMVAEKSSRS